MLMISHVLYSIESTLYPHRWDLAFRNVWKYFPPNVLWYLRYFPSREYRRFKNYQNYVQAYGRKLIARTRVDTKGEGKDIMSILSESRGGSSI